MIIRKYTSIDCLSTLRLFYDTVHTVNAADYSKRQLNAWATGKEDVEIWNKTLLNNYSVVAEIDGITVGFGDIDETGYLNRLYVGANFQRIGVAAAICDELEKYCPHKKIVVHSSITAKGFFVKRSYVIIREQKVERRGVLLTNLVMEKIL